MPSSKPSNQPSSTPSSKHKFKFTTGSLSNSQSGGKFKASLGNDACAVEFTPVGVGLSIEIEMSCPIGTLPSPLKVKALTHDGWFLETVQYSDGLGSSWDSFGPSKVWVDGPPYSGRITGTYPCTNALPCDVQEFTPSGLLSGTASQSSTGWSGSAIKAIDGNYDQYYSRGSSITHTAGGDTNQWWKLDLKVGTTGAAVFKVVVWNRLDCCSLRLNGATVELLDENGSRLASLTMGTNVNVETLVFGVVTGVYAVKIRGKENALSLAEVEVHGYYD
jgi:hypothetical protein